MPVTFFISFTWNIVNYPSPFQFGVNLVSTCTSPKVDATLYHQSVGHVLYLIHTHPNFSFFVGLVSWYVQTPHEIHWKVVKRILWYIQGKTQIGIHYNSWGDPLLVGFIDSDWANDPVDQNSISCNIFTLSLGPIT
jgi:hypothetical protein